MSDQESGSCGVALLTGGGKACRGEGKGGGDEQNLRQEFLDFGEKTIGQKSFGVYCDLESGLSANISCRLILVLKAPSF